MPFRNNKAVFAERLRMARKNKKDGTLKADFLDASTKDEFDAKFDEHKKDAQFWVRLSNAAEIAEYADEVFLEQNFIGIKDEIIEQNFQEIQVGSLIRSRPCRLSIGGGHLWEKQECVQEACGQVP